MASVKLPDGTAYNITTLLGKGDSNAKLAKSDASGKGFLTVGLSLASGNVSGYEVCASRSPGCSAVCLYTAGLGKVHSVQRCRIAKTILFFEQRDTFKDMLVRELNSAENSANRQNKRLAVRLNVLSDIIWEKIFPDLFKMFTNVQFYDYTKHYQRMLRYCGRSNWPSNYHLTFSRSEINNNESLNVLFNKGNVAVVFDNKNLPKKWVGYKVINGDETDLRFLDKPGTVVGLYAKGYATKDDSGFVVPTRIPLTTV